MSVEKEVLRTFRLPKRTSRKNEKNRVLFIIEETSPFKDQLFGALIRLTYTMPSQRELDGGLGPMVLHWRQCGRVEVAARIYENKQSFL